MRLVASKSDCYFSAQFLHEAITQALRDFLPMLNRDLDPRTEFYTIYQRESEDYDKGQLAEISFRASSLNSICSEFIKKHDDYLNTILIFVSFWLEAPTFFELTFL